MEIHLGHFMIKAVQNVVILHFIQLFMSIMF